MPLLIPLTCPRCGSDLAGGAGARIFLCTKCLRAQFMERPEVSYPVVFIQPVLAQGESLLYVPFWRVSGKASLNCPDHKKAERYKSVKALGPLMVPAYWSPRADYYEDFALRYAREPDKLIPGPEAGGTILDGVRAPATLPEIARLTWLAYLDRFADVTGVRLTFKVESTAYACVPFFREGRGYVEGIFGTSIPGSFLVEESPVPSLSTKLP